MFSSAIISSEPRSGKYAQSLSFGNYSVVFEINGTPEQITLDLGKGVVSKLQEIIGQTPEILPSELIQLTKAELGDQIELAMLVVFVNGQKIILSTLGDAALKIVRDGKIINLAGEELSGNLLEGDIGIAGTAGFLAKVDLGELARSSQKNTDELKETLTANLGEGSGLVFRFSLAEQDEQKTELQVEPEPQPQGQADEENRLEEEPENEPKLPTESAQKAGFGEKIKFLTKFIPTKQNILYLKEARENGYESAPPNRKLYLVVLAFVVLLSVIAFQLRSRSLEVQNQNLDQITKQAIENIDSSSKLIGLNDQMARETLAEKRIELIAQIEKDFGSDWRSLKSKDGDQLRKLVAKFDSEIARAAHINNVSKLTTFYDFSLLKAKPEIGSAKLHEGQIVALDRANGSVYALATDNKAATIVGGGDFKKNSFVDFAGDNLFVYTPTGIKKKDITTSSAFKTLAKDASSSGEVSDMAAFAGNIYLLDPGSSQIWKYMGTEEGGLQDPVEYIQPGATLDLASTKTLTIDGFIYVPDGKEVWKFAAGAPEQLELKSLAAPLSGIDSMFASDEAKNIYYWDSSNNRILVTDKDGLYQAQYQLPEVNGGSEAMILADEEQKKIFLISGAKVYGIDIR